MLISSAGVAREQCNIDDEVSFFVFVDLVIKDGADGDTVPFPSLLLNSS